MDFIEQREKTVLATLRLFKALPINPHINPKCDLEITKKTIPYGFVCSPEIVAQYPIDNEFMGMLEQIYGLSAEKLNQSFHKSWVKVKDTPMEQLVVEQLAHYLTTYGKEHPVEYLEEKSEQWGVPDLAEKVSELPDIELGKVLSRDPDYVYIPKEALDIPGLELDQVKLVIIKGYTKEQFKNKLLKLLGSGIALGEDTIKDVVEVAIYADISEKDLVTIKNKEVRVIMFDKLGMFPENPTEFLRFVVYKTTGKTLLIKSGEFITAIKENVNDEISRLFFNYGLRSGFDKLATIFYRFKPLFLAFRQTTGLKKDINKIRKLAIKYHKPMPEDYLNTVTAKNYTTIDIDKLIDELNRVNTFRKIRLAYALKFRTKDVSSILYRIRNGKGYATSFNYADKPYAESVLNIVLESIIQDISKNVAGKKIYIPDYITYTLPATEKQFTGFFPSGTFISMPKDMIFGVHWENIVGHRIDLDLSVISLDGKIGWDRSYRDEEKSILFSGDITDARKPKGATELFYVKKQAEKSLILLVNYFNFDAEIEVPFKIMVAKEHIDAFTKNYMVNPNNVLSVANSKINEKQKILGLAVTTLDECRFYFAESYLGNRITASESDFVKHSRQYLFDFYENTISLNEILQKAGAKIVNTRIYNEECIFDDGHKDIKESFCDIDLSPENIEKDTILNLLINNK